MPAVPDRIEEDSVKCLWQAEQKLAQQVIKSVRTANVQLEDDFFRDIGEDLNGLCEAIAEHIGCDSVAVYFVDQETESQLRIRAACGNLKRLLEKSSLEADVPGAFYNRPEDVAEGFDVEKMKEQIKNWSLTQRAWILGKAYMANSRRDLWDLADRDESQNGIGDKISYNPKAHGWAMRNVFRSLLCIPIFARGRSAPALVWPQSQTEHSVFLDHYHVVGLLKLEGKTSSRNPYSNLAENTNHERITEWENSSECQLADLIGGKADTCVGDSGRMVEPRQHIRKANEQLLQKSGAESGKVDSEIVDFITEILNARFTWDDAEVVVAIAMQLGRMLAMRTMQWADRNGILLDENAVGALDIRYQDVLPLKALLKAATRICRKIEHDLKILDRRIENEGRSDWRTLHPDEPYEHHSPIIDITSRPKELSSLLGKVIRKESVTEGSSKGDAAQVNQSNLCHSRVNLVKRILNVHHIDDIAGICVVCPYLIDIDQLLNAMVAHFPAAGIEFDKKPDSSFDSPKKDGYRAIHFTVKVHTSELLPPEDTKILKEALGEEGAAEPLKLPCEIQLHTAYQHSWSQASHELMYKVDADIPRDLQEHQTILSDILYQADKTANLVRAGVSRSIEGDDHGRARLLEHIAPSSPCIHPKKVTLVEFALRCAQVVYFNRFRFGGHPHFAHAIEVARILLEGFRIDEPEMLMAALLHDLWKDDSTCRVTPSKQPTWSQIIENRCPQVVNEFGSRVAMKCRLHSNKGTAASPALWFDNLMSFLASASAKDHFRDRRFRVNALRDPNCSLSGRVKTNAVILECAIVASRFSELVLDPNLERAIIHFEEDYHDIETLLHMLTEPQLRRRISQCCERIVRNAANELGLTVPIEWSD